MASWMPITNGYQGVAKERNDRRYILWDGYVDGELTTKRLRVSDRTLERLMEDLEK